jgi:S-adenosylmethionine:tRNA ribosyltransferase-isomerase
VVLEALGATPLPPYILRSRAQRGDVAEDALDRAWYQTVFAEAADHAEGASIAAPTAGLHFTDDLLTRIADRGVTIADVVLDVGAGTFKPIDAQRVEDHDMHSETYHVAGATLAALDAAQRAGRMRLAIGTTAVRSLESVTSPTPVDALEKGAGGATELFIRPGFTFRRTDALLTNFHLPRSTLLTLVGALFPDGVARVRELYALAIREQYRFYSYGDAMLVLP